ADLKSKTLRLAYTSTPFRGLDVLLACFPAHYRRHPNCRLDVFSSMSVYGEPDGQDAYQSLYAQCKKTPGVNYRGSVPQTILATEPAGGAMTREPHASGA